MNSRVERYLAHLDGWSGGIEPTFTPIPSTKPELRGVTVIAYPDYPEPGHLVAFTYGLSLARHSDWRLGSPELCIGVRSGDRHWAMAVGFLAERLRGRCPFSYGNTIDFGEQVCAESAMTAFVVFAPALGERPDWRVDVSPARHEGHDVINIAGLYPIHEVERQYIGEHGLEAFWDLDWDCFDVTRPPAV